MQSHSSGSVFVRVCHKTFKVEENAGVGLQCIQYADFNTEIPDS